MYFVQQHLVGQHSARRVTGMDPNDAALSRGLDTITRVSELAVSKLSELQGVGRAGACAVTVKSSRASHRYLVPRGLDANGLATRCGAGVSRGVQRRLPRFWTRLKKHPDIIGRGYR